MIALHSLTLSLLGMSSMFQLAHAGEEECVPWQWGPGKRDLAAVGAFEVAMPTVTPSVAPRQVNNGTWRRPGEVLCNYRGATSSSINYYTCMELATYYRIDIEIFFILNPEIKRDCSNIKPNTEYCVRGDVQPKYNNDGSCGPFAGDTSCPLDSDKPCCSARTWKCGGSSEDCSADNCWSGICPGAKIFSVDGFCGPSHGNTICTGRWGKCCGTNDCCGNSTDSCGSGKCLYGDCQDRPKPIQPANTTSNITPDGTCGGSKGYKCRVEFGGCCSSDGYCGSKPDSCLKSNGCQEQFGKCT